MGEKALIFANKFWDVHTMVVQAVEACPDDRWADRCPGENETVGAVANHIAAGYLLELQLVVASISDQRAPDIYVVEGALDQYHTEASLRFSEYRQAQTLAHLNDNATAVRQFVSELDEADLAKPVQAAMMLKWFGRPTTVETVLQLLIGHTAGHLSSIQKAIRR